jgi:hypothetical protein
MTESKTPHPDLLAALAKHDERVRAVDAMRDEMTLLMKGAQFDNETGFLRRRLLELLVLSLADVTGKDTPVTTLLQGIGTGLQYPLMARDKDVALTQEVLANIASDALAIALGIKTSFVDGDPDDIAFPSNYDEELEAKLDAMERVFPKAIANMKAGHHMEPLVMDPNAVPE